VLDLDTLEASYELLDQLQVGFVLIDPSSRVVHATYAARQFIPRSSLASAVSDVFGDDLISAVIQPVLDRQSERTRWREMRIAIHGRDVPLEVSVRSMAVRFPPDLIGVLLAMADISAELRLHRQYKGLLERQREVNAELQGKLIERLRSALDELSTPVLEIWDDVVALPIIGVLDTQRSLQLTERLLAAVVRTRCRFVVVDLTGVDLIDTRTADGLIRLARNVRLLGAECIFTGIQPVVAQTLADLGVEFASIHTRRNLKQALHFCISMLRAWRSG
jgi:rsbT co-antagonist protein RsbR